MTCQSQPPWWQQVEVTEIFIMHFYFPLDTSSLLGTNILLSTLFSHTLSLCSSLSMTGQASHPYKTASILLNDRYCLMTDPSVC